MNVHLLSSYLSQELSKAGIIEKLNYFSETNTSSAGNKSKEEIFTREFLCPSLANFFYKGQKQNLNLSDDDIRKGLGTEGFSHLPQFGFSPARKLPHIFTKNDVIKNNPPDSWSSTASKPPSNFQACPDFAVRYPLPFNCLGETKLLVEATPESAIKEIYNAARQAIFYLGAFAPAYESILLVIGDITPNRALKKGLALIHPEILNRFGNDTNIHLCCCFPQ